LRGAGYPALSSQLLGLFSLVVAHDIRPEFDHFRTDDALGRHGEAASDRGANGSPGLRIVEVGDGGSGQIANNVA
jgi:hypothetical protein